MNLTMRSPNMTALCPKRSAGPNVDADEASANCVQTCVRTSKLYSEGRITVFGCWRRG